MTGRGPLLVLALLPVLLAGCMESDEKQADVTMAGIRFEPQLLVVKVNDTVVWRNTSTLVHTVTSDNGTGPLDSGDLVAGAAYSYTFTEPGNFTYHCVPHATRQADGSYKGMIGTIVVEA